uniref:Uncharacterized protein n=1 Tax=Fagus sylvatica TaxID=28930 RepID=A0A2N9GIB9_FAGSY
MSLMNFPLDDVKQLLIACADALSKNNMDDFNNLIAPATNVVSVRGEAIERVGIYLIQGLLAKALEIGKSENYSNCAIAGAMRDEEQIHIIDFKIGHGFQWEYLIEELAARPGGAPHVRITGIDDPVSLHARHGEGFEEVEAEFVAMSVEHNIEIEFNGLPVFAPMVTHEMLDLRPGEALAKYCLAREIVNLIACEEDKNMVLRHECFTKWSLRLKAEAGFSQYPLPADNPKLRSMHPYPSSGHYTVVEEDGAVLLNWKGRNLISASAWRL